MAGVQGKGERRIIMIGDNRYGMPEEYDPVRKQKTIMQYREGDTSTRESKAVFNGSNGCTHQPPALYDLTFPFTKPWILLWYL